jgi:hypothetical protein
MKLIHLMSLLCLATTALSAANQPHEADASLVAKTITAHIKATLDPQLNAITKEIKGTIKQVTHQAKQTMRDAQKKAQEKCNEEKKKLYDDFAAFKKEQLETQNHEINALVEMSKESKKQRSLKVLLANTYQYIDALTKYSKTMENEHTIKDLAAARAWFKNIESTSAQAGISFDKSIEPVRKTDKKKHQSVHHRIA